MEKLYLKIGNQDEFDICEKVQGLHFLSDDSTPVTTNQFLEISGADGSQFQYATFGKYQVVANFFLEFKSWEDYKLAKHQINRIFSTKKLIRMRTNVESAIVRYVYPNFPEIKPISDGANSSTFSVNFDNPSGYRYSIDRSDELSKVQYGMYLLDNIYPEYRFTDKSFRVYNPSDIAIDPYLGKHDLKIISKFSGNSLKITNTTNGTSWSYNKSSNGSETILLDGIVTTINGNPATVNTDYGHIVLNTGWNDIVVSGTNSNDITFSFPFIYI